MPSICVILQSMTARLSKEITDALHIAGRGEVEAVDPETGRVYIVVESEVHRQAMEALERQRDRDSIAQGIADMEAGRTKPVQEVHAELRAKLSSQHKA